MVQVRIMKFSLYDSPMPLVFAATFHPEILRGSPERERQTRKVWGEIIHFLALSVNMSKMVGDIAYV